MAERPISIAEKEEKNGTLPDELLNTPSISYMSELLEGMRNDIHEVSIKLGWIVSSVRAAYAHNTIVVEDVDTDELLQRINNLEKQALQVGDTLIADYDN